ncbi:MAG: hypothetical protein ACERKO_07545 [Acetanaerobacterium sp.]
MSTFDDFSTTAQNMFDNACKATGEFVNASKLKIERMNLKSDLERSYLKLGKLHYAAGKNGQSEVEMQAETEIIVKIDTLLEQIASLTGRINQQG